MPPKYDIMKRALKQTNLQKRNYSIKEKLAVAAKNPSLDQEVCQRAEKLFHTHKIRQTYLHGLFRNRFLAINLSESFEECARLCRKFDMDDSGKMKLSEFDYVMNFLGLFCEEGQLRLLAQIFDMEGTGKLEYMEVIAWLEPKVVVEVTKASGIRFVPPTYNKKCGPVLPKTDKTKPPPSAAYMEAWLKQHPEEKERAMEHEQMLNAPTGPRAVKRSTDVLQAGINLGLERSAWGNEKKVNQVLHGNQAAIQRSVEFVRGRFATGEDARQRIEAQWSAADTSRDGLITWQDFLCGLKAAGIETSDSDVTQVMEAMDPLADGGLDFRKFLGLVKDQVASSEVGGMVKDYKLVVGMKADLKKEAELEAIRSQVASAHVDSMWPDQPPKAGNTAALGTLGGGHHWAKTIPNREPFRPRNGGNPIVQGEIDNWYE